MKVHLENYGLDLAPPYYRVKMGSLGRIKMDVLFVKAVPAPSELAIKMNSPPFFVEVPPKYSCYMPGESFNITVEARETELE